VVEDEADTIIRVNAMDTNKEADTSKHSRQLGKS
jgi:hypothetical protein